MYTMAQFYSKSYIDYKIKILLNKQLYESNIIDFPLFSKTENMLIERMSKL